MDLFESPKQPQTPISNGDRNEQIQANSENSESKSPFKNIEIPTLSLPKGGGAIQGIGEKFEVNPATGTSNFSIPIAMSPGRGGMNPQIALSYSSGGGNSHFGMGWNVGVASIVRKTQQELPQYQDYIEADTFILAGAEDLVRTLDEKGNRKEPSKIDGYSVYDYRPRTAGLFARIQRWENESGRSFWKVTTKDNITTIYGKGDSSPIANVQNHSAIVHPEDDNKVFQWFIERIYDDKGNILCYEYKKEDGTGVASKSFEANRKSYSQVYLKRIVYTNEKPYFRGSMDMQAPEFNKWKAGNQWLFELLFDYGEHETEGFPSYQSIKDWEIRKDIFSSFRSGFDIRTYRLCKSIHLFHHIDDEGQWLNEPLAVKSTSWHIDPSPVATQINKIEHLFYDPDGVSIHKMPPVELCYTASQPDPIVRSLPPESLENLPIGIDGQSYRWVDLYGEGISGILHESEGAWHYKSNLGDGELGPTVLVNTKPSLGVLAASAALTDIDGDGRLNLVMRGNGLNGYYEVNQQEEWENFQSFSHNPNLNFNDPNLRMLDLNGDGFADIMITEHDCFVWQRGMAEKGYDSAQFVAKKLDEEKGPRVVFQEGFQSIFLSDMSGDGLTDIVRIRNGAVCYWPNLGYGRFGSKISMSEVPRFDYSDLFDPSRIRLADIDGTGTTDILYLGSKEVSYWHNQSGNRFSKRNVLENFPQIDNIASVQVFDLLGKGTACLVWSSPLAEDARSRLKYLDLMQEKPYLLCESKNNMGAETRITYVSSIKFYLKDKLNGKPWITKLPFAVQVVERSATYDAISNNLFVSKYAYHHGYFDGIEREFRGFGMVEQWDTEDFETLKEINLFPGIDPANFGQKEFDQAPVYTKTWFHNGFYRDGEHISAQYKKEYYHGDEQAWVFPDTNLPEDISPAEAREAARSLKGAMLRQEVYGLDDPALQEHPYTVSENKGHVKQLQSKGENKYGVYFTCSCESLTYHYERNPEDPRIAHSMTLRQDEFGNPTHTASIVYPRRSKEANLAEQEVMYATINETLLTLKIKAQDVFRHSLPLEARSYQLHGIETLFDKANYQPINKLELIAALPWENIATQESLDLGQALDYAASPDESQLLLRLLSRARTTYYNNELTGTLPFGEVESLAMPYQSYTLVFTEEILAQEELENKIGEVELKKAHYQQGSNLFTDGKETDWWHRPGRNLFDAEAANRFYLPLSLRDPYGYVYEMEYDEYFLFPKKTKDPLGNESSASFSYRYLQPKSLLDPNGVITESAFDGRGMMVASAARGIHGEGDLLENHKIVTASLDDDTDYLLEMTESPFLFLGKCSGFFYYDPFAYMRGAPTHAAENMAPLFALGISCATHGNEGREEDSEFQMAITYSDGFGREILAKTQAEDGKGPDYDDAGNIRLNEERQPIKVFTANRWIGSGRTIFNNKGNPVQEYEPFFDSHPYFTSQEALVQLGVSPTIYYDPLDRPIRTELPDGTLSKVAFTPWKQISYDPGDTIAESQWYADKINLPDDHSDKLAAQQSLIHQDTPSYAYLDTLGRPFVQVAHLISQDACGENPSQAYFIPNHSFLNIEGNPKDLWDGRNSEGITEPLVAAKHNVRGQNNKADNGNRVIRYAYAMNGIQLYQDSMDAGKRWSLVDVMGQAKLAWDAKGYAYQTDYDELHRPIKQWLTTDEGKKLVERIYYGEQSGMDYMKGLPYLHLDGSGLNLIRTYDFKANPIETQKRLWKVEHQTLANQSDWQNIVPDWKVLDRVPLADAISAAHPFLEEEEFVSQIKYDALNRPIESTAPDGAIQKPAYNKAALLESMAVKLKGKEAFDLYVKNIDYNEKGQREKIEYGNGVVTRYSYDEKTYRLKHLRSFAEGENYQNIKYTYDPNGNITQIYDLAQPIFFTNNERIEPKHQYHYDSLNRLISAKGRENKENFPCPSGAKDNPLVPQIPANADNVRTYSQQYRYDPVGNILKMKHLAQNGSWTRSYIYADDSNRLLSHDCGDTKVEIGANGYDPHGSMLKLQHLEALNWDYKDQLIHVRKDGEGQLFCFYDAGRQRSRKLYIVENEIKETIYLGGFEIFRRWNSSGTILKEQINSLHIHDDTTRVCLIEQKYKISGNQISLDPSKTHKRFQLNNHLGSSCIEMTENRMLISYEEYHPYGTSSYSSQSRELNYRRKRYRYSGKEKDESTGLYYYGARYYMAWLGRWMSADPGELVDGWNIYLFVLNNPLSKLDVKGFKSQELKANPSATSNSDNSTEKDLEIEKEIERVQNEINSDFDVLENGFSGPILTAGIGGWDNNETQRILKIISKQLQRDLFEQSQRFRNAIMGTIAHRVIALNYRLNHPFETVSSNYSPIKSILGKRNKDIPKSMRKLFNMKPDIFNQSTGALYEIKRKNTEYDVPARRQLNDMLGLIEDLRIESMDLYSDLFIGAPHLGSHDVGTEGSVETPIGKLTWELSGPGLINYEWKEDEKRQPELDPIIVPLTIMGTGLASQLKPKILLEGVKNLGSRIFGAGSPGLLGKTPSIPLFVPRNMLQTACRFDPSAANCPNST